MKTKSSKTTKQKFKKSDLTLQAGNKYFVWGMYTVFLVLVFFASSYKVTGDDDFFWHLATGRFIVQNGYVPDVDVFGFVTSGVEWIPFEWGWDVLTYGLYNLAGYNAILVFRSLMFVLIFLIFIFLFQRFKINSIITLIVLFTLLICIIDRLSPRPHIITYLFFSLLVTIIVRIKYLDRDKYFKWIYSLPVIFLLWGNSHMGVLAGGLFLFIFVISEMLIYFYPYRFSANEIKPLTRIQLRLLLIISVISALTLLINPHFVQTYIYAYNHTKMKLLEHVNEWRSPFTNVMDFGFVILFYKIFLITGILILYYAYKKKDLFFALVWIALAIHSIRAVRFTVDYEILIVFFVAVTFNYLLNAFYSYQVKRLKSDDVLVKKIFSSPITNIVCSILLIYLISQIPSNNIYAAIKYYRVFGWGINDDFLPMQLFDFKKEINLTGKPFNHFGTGGSLVWLFPEEKNFIDSRNLNDEIYNEYNSIMVMSPGFEKQFEEREIDYAIFLDPDLVRRSNEMQRLVVSYFIKSHKWKLIFWDDKSFLFVKDIPKFKNIIDKYEYQIIEPYTATVDRQRFLEKVKSNPDRAIQELKRKSDTEPNGIFAGGIYQIVKKVIDK